MPAEDPFGRYGRIGWNRGSDSSLDEHEVCPVYSVPRSRNLTYSWGILTDKPEVEQKALFQVLMADLDRKKTTGMLSP